MERQQPKQKKSIENDQQVHRGEQVHAQERQRGNLQNPQNDRGTQQQGHGSGDRGQQDRTGKR